MNKVKLLSEVNISEDIRPLNSLIYSSAAPLDEFELDIAQLYFEITQADLEFYSCLETHNIEL